jgi:hypothetical protein
MHGNAHRASFFIARIYVLLKRRRDEDLIGQGREQEAAQGREGGCDRLRQPGFFPSDDINTICSKMSSEKEGGIKW